ncbi:hypothetical protein, partial [Paenibacillus sp. Y412MC10]|uniref:hypothetical protein n=1 Tax=Geobacillus sp. (strain Y412MC10) TaxID=481743 RepID=UPI001C92F230
VWQQGVIPQEQTTRWTGGHDLDIRKYKLQNMNLPDIAIKNYIKSGRPFMECALINIFNMRAGTCLFFQAGVPYIPERVPIY